MKQFDQDRSNKLYESSLDQLIRAMKEPNVGADDSLLVAAVVMHLTEELRDLEHSLNLESRGHLVAMQVFLDDEASLRPTGLRVAAFRAASREELQLCFTDQQPIRLPADATNVDRGLSNADDYTWAWRIILLCKDCLAFSLCPSSTLEWDSLYEQTFAWSDNRPASFNPTFYRQESGTAGSLLPEIWYLYDTHITGAYHSELCSLLLAISNPRTPRFGLQKHKAEAQLKLEIRKRMITICGIASTNASFPPAMTAAAAVITAWAEHIHEPDLQDALIGLLIRTEELHGWPTDAARKHVREVWGRSG